MEQMQPGQYFTVDPPVPHPRSWLIPIGVGAISLVGCLLVVSTGSNQPPSRPQTPPLDPSQAPLAQAPPASAPSIVPPPPLLATQRPKLDAHVVQCDRTLGANLRRYPSLDPSLIVRVIPCGQPLTLIGEQVRSDGVTWLAVQYQQQSG